MKKLLSLLSALTLILGFTACGGDDEGDTPTPTPTPTDIKHTTCSIIEGEVIDATAVTSITVNYAEAININPKVSITLNGTAVTATKAATVKPGITIAVALQPGTNYELVLPRGTVISAAKEAMSAEFRLKFSTKKTESSDLPDNDAMKVTRMLGFGWNLGNHFDTGATNDDKGNPIDFQRPKWGYWDKAKPTEQLYKRLAEAGVKTVRIPVTWGPYQTNNAEYTIADDYMAEVKQNVLWAKAAGLVVILNTHHDEYWMDAYSAAGNEETNTKIKNRIEATWKQIANAFKDEGDYLILESFNELNHNWQNPTNGELRIQNEWNQLVVDVIRATGGNNATRWIAVPAYQASSTQILSDKFVIPTDKAKKIIAAFHSYDPYGFTLQDPFDTEKWGHKSGNAYDEKNVTDFFKKIRSAYIDKNIPVYMGEFGCSRHSTDQGNKCRDYYLEYFCRAAYYNGVAGFLWDNHNPGGGPEHHAYFDHNNGAWLDGHEYIVKTMIKAMTSTDATYTLESIYNKAP